MSTESELTQLTEAQWEFIEEIVANAYMTATDIEFLDNWIRGMTRMSIKDMMKWLNAIDVRNKLLERDLMEVPEYEYSEGS